MRMHEVSPSSGTFANPGSRMSDRELMQNVIEMHDIKMMLRNTAHRPSSFSGGIVIVPGAMARAVMRMGKPGQVPAVAQTARKVSKRMLDAIVKGIAAALYDDDLEAPLTVSGGGDWNHPRFVIDQICDRRNETVWNTLAIGSCGNSTTSTNKWPPPNNIVTSNISSFGPPNSNITGNPMRAKHYDAISFATTGRWRRAVRVSKMPRNVPASSSDFNMSSLPRSRRPAERTFGYRRAAVSQVVVAGKDGQITRDGPPTRTIHREVPTKTERKSRKKLGFALLGAYHKLTEINDLVDALADAIPDKRCSALPGFAKLVCVVENWDEIDPLEAGKNVIANEIEDRIVGRLQSKLSDALKKSGGPNSTQVQQFARQLTQYVKGVL